MSATTADWTLPETEAPASPSSEKGEKDCREEEFRSALDTYMAEYADCQKHRGAATTRPVAVHIAEKFALLAEWLRHRVAVRKEQRDHNFASR